ncbi:hypothetical protein ACFE04_013403 [Oxalis oulophora]
METGTSSNPSCKDADCLSLLPTHVVLHILSFSPMESIAKLSLTSKKYRDLCLSIQSMFISDSKMKFSNSVHRLQYLKFLVKFMRDRQHAEMTKFSLWWSMEELSPNENFHIMRLIKYPIMCHVENLKLTLNLQSGAFMLTPELLALTNLTINLRGGKLNWAFDSSRITSLHVSAPVLIDLYWWGYFPFNYFLKKSNCLQKALLNVRHPNSSRFKLNGLLPSIVHVPRLIINSSTIMGRGDRTIFLEFENLEFLQGLEEIHVELVCKMYEIWLLEYLLKHAKVLKKVTIIFEPTMPRTVTDKLNAAALARGGNLCFEGQKMVFELK